jgi:hypothetical protein
MWTIKLLEYTNNDDKAVLVAHWGCELVDGDYSASSYGTCGFSPDPSDPAYIPYESLTEADVLAWVYESVDKDATEAALAANIEDQKAPQTITGTPWN